MLRFTVWLTGILIAHVAVSAEPAGKDLISAFQASRFAAALDRVRKPEDLLKLGLSKQDREILRADIKSKIFKDFAPPQISLTSAQTVWIVAGRRQVSVDFTQLSQHELKISGRTVKLQPQKTLLNYRGEIEAALSAKHASLWNPLWSTAQADMLSWVSDFVSVGVSEQAVELKDLNLAEFHITENLKRAYDQEAQKAFEQGRTWHTFIFACNKRELSHLEETVLIADGVECSSAKKPPLSCQMWNHRVMDRDPHTGNFKITDAGCAAGKSESNSDGMVLKGLNPGDAADPNNTSCPFTGRDINRQKPFFGFFGSVQACCGVEGCPEAVQAEITSLKAKFKSAPTQSVKAQIPETTD